MGTEVPRSTRKYKEVPRITKKYKEVPRITKKYKEVQEVRLVPLGCRSMFF
jgi:hypothetical protein